MDITKKININLILIILLISCVIYFTFTNNEGYSNIDIEKINFDFNNERINKVLNYVATTYFNNEVTISELNDPNSINIDNLKNLNEANIITETQVIKDNLVNLSFGDIKYLLAYAKIYRSVFNYFYISNNDNNNKKKLKMYLNIIDVGISELNKELIAKQNIVDSNMPSYSNDNIKKTFGSLSCPIGKTYLPSNSTSSNGICCPPNNQNINNKCCPTSRVNSEKMVCCPEGKIDIGGICCAPDNKNIKGQCCPPDKNIGNDICCKSNEIIATDSNDANNKICCPEGQYNIDGICCDDPNDGNFNGVCGKKFYDKNTLCNGNLIYWNFGWNPPIDLKEFDNLTDNDADNKCKELCNNSISQCNGYLVEQSSTSGSKYCELYNIEKSYLSKYPIYKSCNYFSKYTSSVNSRKSYYYISTPMTWDEHNENAKRYPGGSLVCFNTNDEFNKVFNIAMKKLNNKSFWCGGERIKAYSGSNGPKTAEYWKWTDNAEWMGSVTTDFWNNGEPNNDGGNSTTIKENGIQVYTNGKWNDLPKTYKLAAVYQRIHLNTDSFGNVRNDIPFETLDYNEKY